MKPRARPRRATRPRNDAPVERRGGPRFRPSRSARLLDISPGGLCIETAAPLAKGQVCDLLLRIDDRRMPVACRVVRIRKTAGGLRASLCFDRILEPDREYLERSLVREVAERMTVVVR